MDSCKSPCTIGVLVLLIKPLGLYMARVFNGERTFLDPVLRPVERLIYRLSGVDPRQEQHWTTYTAAMLIFNLSWFGAALRPATAAARAAAESAGLRPSVARLGLQYGREFRQQHQLAVLRRRKHDELSVADGRPDGAKLCLGGDGHRPGYRADSGFRAPFSPDPG